MFKHPDLILDAPMPYFGLRGAPPEAGKRGKMRRHWFSFPELQWAIDRSPSVFGRWELFHGVRDGGSDSLLANPRQMPRFMSAYMALIGSAHPHYVMLPRTRNGPYAQGGLYDRFPPLQRATYAEMAEVMNQRGPAGDVNITEDELREAFGYVNKSQAHYPDNHQQGTRSIPNDKVRWGLFQLMTDTHKYAVIEPRDPARHPKMLETVRPAPHAPEPRLVQSR